MIEKAYLTVEEVAQRFGIDRTTVYRLAQRGKLPGFKVGGQWRFSESGLREWMASAIVSPQKVSFELLKELGVLKSEFVAGANHELRTPLTAIREGISQILEGICGRTTQVQRSVLLLVLKNVDRLCRFVNEPSNMSKDNSSRNTRPTFILPKL